MAGLVFIERNSGLVTKKEIPRADHTQETWHISRVLELWALSTNCASESNAVIILIICIMDVTPADMERICGHTTRQAERGLR